MRRLNRRALCLGCAGLVATLFGSGSMPTAKATQPDGAVVTLTYDAGTDTLLKAYAHALYRSGDGGRSWHKIAVAKIGSRQLLSVTASPVGKGVMYVAGSESGVLRTDDGGKTWVERNEGLSSRNIIAVAAHTTQPDTVYAVVNERGFYRSQDGGLNWRLMERSSQDGLRQLVHSNLPGSMQTGWLFAATAKGVRRVMDCFCLWQDAGKLGSQAYGVAYDPRQPERMYTITEKGLFRSMDGGENWVQITSPSSMIVALAFKPSGRLFAINAEGVLYESEDQGSTWKQVNA